MFKKFFVLLIGLLIISSGVYADKITSWGSLTTRSNSLKVNGNLMVATSETRTEPLSVNGTIESYNNGGIKFPDGTIQTTAASGTLAASVLFVDVTGDTMTGILTASAGITNYATTGANTASFVDVAGDTMTGGLSVESNVTAEAFFGDGVNLTNVLTNDVYVNISGDTMTGALIINGANLNVIGSAEIGDSNCNATGINTVAIGNSSATGNYSFASGYNTTANSAGTGYGGINIGSVAMGINTLSSGYGSTATGYGSTASAPGAFATGYKGVVASAFGAFAAGKGSTASSPLSIAMGRDTSASNIGVAMGAESICSGFGSVSIGDRSTASGATSVAMGRQSTASGDWTFAIGRKANAANDGSFVWADSTDATFSSTANDQFLIRATGGVGIGTFEPQTELHVEGDLKVTGTIEGASPVKVIGGLNLLTGNLGVNDSDPDSPLTVNGTIEIDMGVAASPTGMYHLFPTINNDIAFGRLDKTFYFGYGTNNLYMDANSVNRMQFNALGTTFNSNANSIYYIVKGNADANLLYVNGATDRVGIGTNGPGQKLTVAGSVELTSGDIILGDDQYVYLGDDTDGFIAYISGQDSIAIGNAPNGPAFLADFTTPNAQIFNVNNHINVLSDETVMNALGNDIDLQIQGSTEANLIYVNAGTDRVGIGTPEPTSLLTVNGTTEIKNDLLFTDAGSGLSFGEITVVSNTIETTITTQGVSVQITVFDTNGCSNNTTPDHTSDDITILKEGCYLVNVSATVNSIAGAASKLEITCKKNNGTSDVIPHMDRNMAGGGGEAGVISMSGIADLAVNDTIEIWIENETNTQNYVVEDISLSLVQIGGN
jgi:hypothetical protein